MRITIPAEALLAASALSLTAPALAQEPGAAELAAEIAAMRAKVESLEAKVKELESGAKAEAPSWKGAPQFADQDKGWSFKPFGRLQYDVGHVGNPEGVDDPGLGFGSELRRARLGVEGSMPGGFGYKIEADFADNSIELTDAFLTYQAMDGLGIVAGQHNNFQSLEELTSSRFHSFIERAAFTDAFNFERRVGLSATYAAGEILASAGVFTDNINDLSGDENNAMSFDGRVVFMPKLGATQLHAGGSAHFRDNGETGAIGATRYRQRPLVHFTDTRFLATPSLDVEKETSYGLELAAINGPLHATGEAHWLKADALGDGADPGFFGAYAEIGYFLTGETRGYKNGRFDRTKVLHPVGKGGFGAFQVNLRYDHLDLNDGIVTGGKQAGYQASLIWIPQDYVRLLLNYGYLDYEDAAVAEAGGDRDYGISVWGARAQVDF